SYVDDTFGASLASEMTFYAPYGRDFPTGQAKMLWLWDTLGVPHEEQKQLFGERLTIIGFEVDPNAMTITMPAQSRRDLLEAMRDFRMGQRLPLRSFQRMAGWINWSLNVYPLLRPALSTLYAKTAGKRNPHEPMYVNKAIQEEFAWFCAHVARSDGVCVLSSEEWGP
ncbi:hypothetical protein BOTBODRAFT_74084, partial [Botryobasidium botryosum FD-172 SS1]